MAKKHLNKYTSEQTFLLFNEIADKGKIEAYCILHHGHPIASVIIHRAENLTLFIRPLTFKMLGKQEARKGIDSGQQFNDMFYDIMDELVNHDDWLVCNDKDRWKFHEIVCAIEEMPADRPNASWTDVFDYMSGYSYIRVI